MKQLRLENGITAAFKMVDTCAAEFEASTPYYYSVYGGENESVPGHGRILPPGRVVIRKQDLCSPGLQEFHEKPGIPVPRLVIFQGALQSGPRLVIFQRALQSGPRPVIFQRTPQSNSCREGEFMIDNTGPFIQFVRLYIRPDLYIFICKARFEGFDHHSSLPGEFIDPLQRFLRGTIQGRHHQQAIAA